MEGDRVDVRSLIGAWENLKMESIDSINDVSADDDGNPRSDDPMGQGVETCVDGPAEKRTTPTEFEVVDDDDETSLSGCSITSMASADMSVEEIKQIYDSFSHATGSDGVKNPDDGHSDALLFDWEKLEHEGETFECDFDLWKFEEVIQEGCYRRLRAFEGFQQFHKLGSREMAGYSIYDLLKTSAGIDGWCRFAEEQEEIEDAKTDIIYEEAVKDNIIVE